MEQRKKLLNIISLPAAVPIIINLSDHILCHFKNSACTLKTEESVGMAKGFRGKWQKQHNPSETQPLPLVVGPG